MPRTVEQRMTALEKANRVRLGRAAVKRSLKDGTLPLADALIHPDVQSETASRLLLCLNGAGKSRVRKWLTRVPCSEFVLVGDLTSRQRRVLALLVEGAIVSGECSACGAELQSPALLCGFCEAEQ